MPSEIFYDFFWRVVDLTLVDIRNVIRKNRQKWMKVLMMWNRRRGSLFPLAVPDDSITVVATVNCAIEAPKAG